MLLVAGQALLTVAFLFAFGLRLLGLAPSLPIDRRDRLFFAPAVGIFAASLITLLAYWCGVVGYVRWIGWILAAETLLNGRRLWPAFRESDRLWRFTAACLVACVLIAQLTFSIFRRVSHDADRIGTIYNATGVAPPDQMFSWHQAVFYRHGLRYPQDRFYGDFDLFDRPHGGGLLTLFFFESLGIELPRDGYPDEPLRYYDALWWSVNSLYLLGVAVLVRRLFDERTAMIAVGLTVLSGHFLLSTLGLWAKFAAAYPLLLAVLLALQRGSGWWQALLGATGFHLHGSVLGFLVGIGVLHIGRVLAQFRGRPSNSTSPARDMLGYTLASLVLIGPWFIVPRMLGSRQPLMNFYLYDAGLSEAQTTDDRVFVDRFYRSTTLGRLVALPAYNIAKSLVPIPAIQHIADYSYHDRGPLSPYAWAGASMFSQIRYFPSGLGLWAVPLVYAGLVCMLRLRNWDMLLFWLYLAPTLWMAVVYRQDGVITNHIITPYHAIALLAACLVLRRCTGPAVAVMMILAAVETGLGVLFADDRFVVVKGCRGSSLLEFAPMHAAGFAITIIVVMAASIWMANRTTAGEGLLGFDMDPREIVGMPPIMWKVGLAMLVTFVVLGAYAMIMARHFTIG